MWSFQHSVECQADKDFAWRFWTDVSNWPVVDSSVESATLDGPFATGTTVTTKPRGLDAIEGRLVAVQEGTSALIEIPAPGAVLKFLWKFEEVAPRRTRMTQQASIAGEQADEYAEIGKQMESGIPQAMQRIADEITNSSGKAGGSK